jgi:O-antigen/teichoic acid export membrane protein
MRRNKFLTDISISSVQAVLNQLSGIIVFFIISNYLTKASLGQINWALAVLMVVFAILGFGLEHVAVRKAATGTNPSLLLQVYLLHVLVAGGGFIALFLIMQFCFPVLRQNGQLFLLLSISQCLSFLATPFRQIVSGLEKFKALFIMSSAANLIKVLALLLMAFWKQVSLYSIIEVYLLASFAELLVCVFVYRVSLKMPIVPGYSRQQYASFIKEALPQLGVTIFNTALARMDWILLGLLSTSVMVAEYSFTNKLFELSTLPLLIVAPIIFPRIAKMFANKNEATTPWKMDYLKTLVRIEMVVAAGVALAVNICWKDIIDPMTDNKYGASTREIIFVMSFAMPIVYLNNIFWSILFAEEKMKVLFRIFFYTFLVNVVADFILIPLLQAKGAALGFVLALAIQVVFYFRETHVEAVRRAVIHLLPVAVSALVAGFVSVYLFDFFVWQLIAAGIGYFLLLGILGQLGKADWQMVKKMMTAG